MQLTSPIISDRVASAHRRTVEPRRSLLWAAGLALISLNLTSVPTSFAQGAYPNHPIKLIVPWPPGQATDLAGRVVAQELSKELGQSVVVENKAGAGGTIGTDMVAKAAPDGYTVLMASSGPVTVSPLLQQLPYNSQRDLAPIAMVGLSPYVLATAPNFPAKDIREFVALVKANPGTYTFASSGTGATAHLIAESFNGALGLKSVHVPYKGSSPALTDVSSGQVSYSVETAAATMPFVRSGRLKGYGVSLAKGSTVTPGMEPIAKTAGIPGFDLGAWLGVMVPAGTPAPIVNRLSTAVAKIMALPEVIQAFNTIAVEVDYRNANDFKSYLSAISTEFSQVIKANNIKLD